MAVLDIRGTHGSGKSWIAHRLLSLYDGQPIEEGGIHLGYHLAKVDAALVGKYKTACGGCDGVGSADEVVRRVRLFAKTYRHVVLEGILVSHTFRRYSNLATELADYGYTFAFLDTPLEQCIARVEARRKERGVTKPLNPANVIKDWHCVWETVRGKCKAVGHSVVELEHSSPLPTVLSLLWRKP